MANTFLVVAPAWVGDMVMAQTLFMTLKQLHPNCHVDVVAPKSTLPLLNRMPEIRQAIALPAGHGSLSFGVRKQLGRSLRSSAYDQAFVLPNSWKSALVPWFAKVKKRTGWRGEMRYGLLNDVRKLDKTKYPRMIERFIALAYDKDAVLPADLPKPKLSVDDAAKKLVCDQFQLNLEKPVLALCPGAEYGPAKQWPASHYAKVAHEKAEAGWQVWLFGSPKDKAVADEIQIGSCNRCVNLAGKTNLLEAVDLLACASAVVTNDSGLMHVACALEKKVIALYGSSSPKFTPPLNEQATILSLHLACSPCFKRDCPLGHLNCLKKLMPEQVLAAL